MNKELRDLVHDFTKGDHEAFTELVRRYKKKVYSLAFRMLENHLDADEVTQETFVRIYEKRNQLRSADFFSSFILRIATNYAIDLIRKRQKRFVSVEDDEEMVPSVQVQLADKIVAPDRALENEELSEVINRAISLLPPRQKITVILHDVEGYTMEEVAVALDCPEATVRSNLHIARLKLRKWLAKKLR
ncbi:MAG: RNA polymerase sigma factor [candidate division Zixibacteria bacterium]|jgi:RNA polymerase sigma-70 factor (ECF subfamily)|nr:RNA polymerase sigma factor [candidate division Zixibacteria bacterium]